MRPMIEVVGDRALRAALKKAGDDLSDMKASNLAGAQIVADRAGELVPVVSGRLKNTIRAGGGAASANVRAGLASIRYAGPLHFGHGPPRAQGGYMVPNPFLYDAVDDRREEVLEMYQDRVKRALSKLDGI